MEFLARFIFYGTDAITGTLACMKKIMLLLLKVLQAKYTICEACISYLLLQKLQTFIYQKASTTVC